MSFLAFILALVLYRVWDDAPTVQSDDWFYRWRDTVSGLVSGDVLTLLLVLLPLMIGLRLLSSSVDDLLFGLPWIGLAALLLLYTFGRGDVSAAIEQYRAALLEGEFPLYAQAASVAAAEDESEAAAQPQDVHRQNRLFFFYQSFQGWFAVVFFFLVLGPAAALGYRLLQLYNDSSDSEAARRFLFFLDWLPARLLAASFAATGDFLRSRDELLAALTEVDMPADEVLANVGIAALGRAPELNGSPGDLAALAAHECEEMDSLMSRTGSAWVALVAIWVVFA